MRKHAWITVFVFLMLIACDYDAPLVGEASLPIDQALLGTWELIPEDRSGQESFLHIVIRQESANVYDLKYEDDDATIYAKGWLAELEKIRFMQVEVTGDEEDPIDVEYTDIFSVYSYALDNGELVVKSLNIELVNEYLADSAALQAAFVAHMDDPGLFREPERFRKLSGGSGNFTKKW